MAKRNVAPRTKQVDELAARRLAISEREREISYAEDVYQKAAARLEEMRDAHAAKQKAEREWILSQPDVVEFPRSRVRAWDVKNAIHEAFQKIIQQHPELEPRKAWRSALAEIA